MALVFRDAFSTNSRLVDGEDFAMTALAPAYCGAENIGIHAAL